MIIQQYDGTGDGKLLVISGIHGNEYTPIEALYQLEKDIEYINELKTKYSLITFLHAVNEYGIKNNTREYCSNNDLNRIFSNDELKDELIEFINDSDYIIDIHASKDCTEFVLLNNNEYVNSYIKYCKKHKINYAVWAGSNNTIKAHSIKNKKIAFTIECNGLGTVKHKSLLKTMKLIKKVTLNKMDTPKSSTILAENFLLKTITASSDGILVWTNKDGFFIRAIDGTITYTFKNSSDGYNIILRNKSGYVKNGDYIFQHQPLIDL